MNQNVKKILLAIAVTGSSCAVFAQNQVTNADPASGSAASDSMVQTPSGHKAKKTMKSIPPKSQKADADSASTSTKDPGAKGGQ